MKNQQLTTIFIVLGAAAFIYSIFLAGGDNANIDLDIQSTACTEEAFICPDGGAVGRVGPECEFAPCPTETPCPAENVDTDLCTQNGGIYDKQHNECLGVDAGICAQIGGVFDECASPCRHDKEATMCILSCALVCEL